MTCIFYRITSVFFSDKPNADIVGTTQVSQSGKSTETCVETSEPAIAPRILNRVPPFMTPRQVWVENFNTVQTNCLGIVDLHPEIFGARPRIDLIHENVVWQMTYRKVVRILPRLFFQFKFFLIPA